ncbi:protein CMSS1 isoform X2 [Pempheris klunzingeri]|uniref:protein CMSS1 isoform X2 n=1 Tax=Pempheris klunzingeri TaxID=3127111 RepID=UPI003981899A
MGDDLGDEWWDHEGNSDASEPEEETQQERQPTETPKTEAKPEKRKGIAQKTVKAKKKKKNEQKECISPPKTETEGEKSAKLKKKRKKKKTITDVLSSSEPKPGCPADLQNMVTKYFSDKLSVVEQDELKLDSCFLTSNDMTHSLSSYLKQVCPKWSKIQKQHTENSSVVLLIVCSSALRTIELIKQLTTFKGEAKAIKLFAKHIKIEEQVKLLQKGVTHIGVGTPGRISALIEREGLNLQALKYLVLDWNWRDQKLRRMLDIPEIKLDFMKLLESGILNGCKEDRVKIGLF